MTTARGVLANPAANGRSAECADSAPVSRFHGSLPDYQPTPLVSAPSLAERLGVGSVHVKDESNRLAMPSFKILGASWATFRVLCDVFGADPDVVADLDGLRRLVADSELTLVAATDGNHGRALARMAGLLGLDAQILVPQDMVAARIQAIEDEGAEVVVVPGTYDEAVSASARLADDRHIVVSDTSWEGYRQVPGWVIDGYSTIVAEVSEQLAASGERAPTVVVVQIGVGAFASAMIRGFLPRGARIIGSEPTLAACVLESVRAGRLARVGGRLDSSMAGLNCGTPSPIAWPEMRSGISTLVAVDDADAEEAMRALASVGVVSGESGAAGLAALLAFGPELDLRADDRVLIISTEGATDPVAYAKIVG
ncbi:diaminopropionate ammonia-lyase [Nocardia sp. NPDC052254]|uniref:diaminopropionate ammonia-lyase n=1 Tax=Nocardia sp. NPDC052254 TaxID=3155681 RepID=UPI00341EC876